MTEYWVSNPRKFCEVCKCWFGDNEASVSFHEQGRRHKANVQRQLKDARNNASEAEKDKKKTEAILASIEHAAISAYHKDLTASDSGVSSKRTIQPATDEEEEHARKVLEIASTIAAEKNREVEKITIQENIAKKVGQLKAESMAWQPLFSPQGYIYYYNSITEVSQWEAPAGYTPPPQSYPTPTATTSQTPTTQDPINHLTNQVTESNEHKRSASPDTNEDGPSSPKRIRRSGPYGGWETVAEYEYVEPVAESTTQEAVAEETKEEIIEFEEKTLPVTETVEAEDAEDREYSGGFKKFSFKKRGRSGRAQIRQRTTEQT